MRQFATVLTLAFASIAAAQPPGFDDPFGKPKQLRSFDDGAKISTAIVPAKAKPGQAITFTVTIAPELGCWTYPANTKQSSKNIFLLPADGEVRFLSMFADPPGAATKKSVEGPMLHYPDEVTWRFEGVVSPSAKPGKLKVELKNSYVQVCNAMNCLPYAGTLVAEVEVLAGPAEAVPEKFASLFVTSAPPRGPAEVKAPMTAEPEHMGLVTKTKLPTEEYQKQIDELLKTLETKPATRSGGLGAFLLTAMFWGIVSLVTPCVFPMIPITVSLFLKQSNQSAGGAVKLAAIYCVTIIAVMAAAAYVALDFFRAMSVNPITNILLGVLFLVLALSLFGLFTLQLPSFLLRYTEGKRKAGGTLGTVFGAIAFSIVSFTCVAPFLGGFAGLAASGQYQRHELILAALAFAAAFASPFFVLALFPSLLKALPKSGGWLETVKVVMGFLEIAAALKFFRTAELLLTPQPTFFTYDVVLTGWVVTMIVTGLYLLNLVKLPHDDRTHVGVWQLLFAMVFIGLGVYLWPGAFKTANGPQRPGGVVFAWVDAFLLPEPGRGGDELPWSADLPGTIAKARADKKRIFVDFTGETCTNCKDNEKNVFPKPEVQSLLKKYTLVQLYTDKVPNDFFRTPPSLGDAIAEGRINLKFQNDAFSSQQLPLYVILEPTATGARTVAVYDEGKINNVPAFVEFLKAVER
jgi:thiol:disulfide interchange protein DsbD